MHHGCQFVGKKGPKGLTGKACDDAVAVVTADPKPKFVRVANWSGRKQPGSDGSSLQAFLEKTDPIRVHDVVKFDCTSRR
jgi:hypothetical protein